MSTSDIVQIVTLVLSLISTFIAAFAARVAKQTRADLDATLNAENIRLINVRLDQMALDDAILEKSGEQVRIRLVGLSGDNGLVHDIIRLKDEVATLKTQSSVISDRLQMEIGTREEGAKK